MSALPDKNSGDEDKSKPFSRTPTSWDAEDDILLMHLKDQQKLGWKEIASHFTNRTPNACQFRWRRLKSGNLKNPPKSAAALGTQIKPAPKKKPKKEEEPPIGLELLGLLGTLGPIGGTGGGFPAAYSPIANTPFTGYENVSNALAGLNVLLNTPLNISSPLPNYTNPSTPGVNSPRRESSSGSSGNTHNYESPKEVSEVSLDPNSHNNSSANVGGGYYTDISIDPTSNLPHNQPHPHSINRNSKDGNMPHHRILNSALHNNSIIQIARDDRASVLSTTRASVSSLPSKSMNIPHHQLTNSALAHMPILFGGAGSISGPLRNPSISGPGGIHHSNTVTSLRNGSIGSGPLTGLAVSATHNLGPGYYSRSGSVVIPYNAEKKEDEQSLPKRKLEKKTKKPIKVKPKTTVKDATPVPVFKIPWSMEEDELLINRRNRELSFAELSILLPQRTEGEIWSRIDYLEKLRNGHRSSTSRDDHRRRRESLVGLDDVDDFYDFVIGGIGMSEDDGEEEEDDEVLVDVDDSPGQRKKRKRRASSAVNPLSVGDTIRRRLR